METLRLFERTRHFTEVEGIAIINRRGLVRFQALAVEAGGVGAVQVGERIRTADVLEGGMNTRDGVRALGITQVYFWLDAANVMIGASHHGPFAGELDLLAVTEVQVAPGGSRIIGRLGCWFRCNRLGSRWRWSLLPGPGRR